jgi:hypothetical protein
LEGREGLVGHLLAFNLGIEVAQLLVVVIILLLNWLVVEIIKIPRLWWLRVASFVIFGVFTLLGL